MSAGSAGGLDYAQFYQVFFEEAGENLVTMERLLLGLDAATVEDETLHAIFRCAHSIKGGAATFGFDELAGLTHVMETLLDRLRRHELAPNPARVDALLAACDALGELLRIRQQESGEALDTRALREQLTALSQDAAAPAAPAAPAPEAPALEAMQLQAAATPASIPPMAAVAPATSSPSSPPAAPGTRDLELLAGPLAQPGIADDLLDLFREVRGLGDLSPVEARADQPAGCARFRLHTTSTDGELMDLCQFHLPPDQVRLSPWSEGEAATSSIPAPVPAAVADDHEIFEPLPPHAHARAHTHDVVDAHAEVTPSAASGAATPAASPAHDTHAPAGPRGAARKPAETIRVSVDKVDQLINLMGELVITQAMLAQRAAHLDRDAMAQLGAGLVDLERTTRDLQESVMSMRMIPMADVFGRFPRMVRDLAARLGKEIELRTVGEATELDKGMIEKLTDPLTHLVRNAVDHGIEDPAAREAAGKPRRGLLTLSAAHEGGSILIRVRDDGRGLDRARLLDKARRSGLALPPDMSDAQVWQLIFAPGFSTADQVTDVSGRGVGMDVVKRNILALGGSVEIDNRLGEGLCVSVRLPLTLAIMDGMSVTVCEDLYLLPLSCVIESFQAPPEAIRSLAGGGRVLRVREDWLPVVDLAAAFHPGWTRPPQAPRMHVVVEAEGQRVALELDQLVGQQQVVVKNLEANYRRVPGFSGATILADGRVALILDVTGLVRQTRA